jgi:hypothetical protein
MPTPRKPRLNRFAVTIRSVNHGTGDMPGFLDMLRYEGGRVVEWTRIEDNDSYLVTIEVEALRHVPDRWRSFGIYPQEVQ